MEWGSIAEWVSGVGALTASVVALFVSPARSATYERPAGRRRGTGRRACWCSWSVPSSRTSRPRSGLVILTRSSGHPRVRLSAGRYGVTATCSRRPGTSTARTTSDGSRTCGRLGICSAGCARNSSRRSILSTTRTGRRMRVTFLGTPRASCAQSQRARSWSTLGTLMKRLLSPACRCCGIDRHHFGNRLGPITITSVTAAKRHVAVTWVGPYLELGAGQIATRPETRLRRRLLLREPHPVRRLFR